MSRGEVVKAGYLTKSPPERVSKVAQWHRRWFVLSDSHKVYPLAKRYVRMEYYQGEDDTKRMKNPKGRPRGEGRNGLFSENIAVHLIAHGHEPPLGARWFVTGVR